jgi:integrase
MGDGNERTGDENSSRRERSETADGRRNPGHRKGSASRREDIPQGRGGHNTARIHLALERVLMIAPTDARFPGCAYALAKAGHDTRALQAWLGHKNIQHTVRYTELSPHRFKDFWR